MPASTCSTNDRNEKDRTVVVSLPVPESERMEMQDEKRIADAATSALREGSQPAPSSRSRAAGRQKQKQQQQQSTVLLKDRYKLVCLRA